jgi:hypothetical protein
VKLSTNVARAQGDSEEFRVEREELEVKGERAKGKQRRSRGAEELRS